MVKSRMEAGNKMQLCIIPRWAGHSRICSFNQPRAD